jgi:hypothetical protein
MRARLLRVFVMLHQHRNGYPTVEQRRHIVQGTAIAAINDEHFCNTSRMVTGPKWKSAG